MLLDTKNETNLKLLPRENYVGNIQSAYPLKIIFKSIFCPSSISPNIVLLPAADTVIWLLKWFSCAVVVDVIELK